MTTTTHGAGRRRRSLAVVGLLALVAACGGADSGDDTVETTEVAAPVTTASPSTTAEPATTTTQPVTTTESPPAEDAHDDAPAEGDQSNAAGDEAASGRVVQIIMDDFTFEPAVLTVTAGETITFVVVNEGVVPHELRLSNAHRIEEHLASGHDDHGDDGDEGHHDDGDVFIELEPGMTGELVVTFPEDQTVFTEMACLLPGHYEAGMLGPIEYG